MKKRPKTEDLIHAYEIHSLGVRELSRLSGLCPAAVSGRLKKAGVTIPQEEPAQTTL